MQQLLHCTCASGASDPGTSAHWAGGPMPSMGVLLTLD